MSQYTFVQKHPDRAYISNRLWLPKKSLCPDGLRVEPVKRALEFTVGNEREVLRNGALVKEHFQDTMRLWTESRSHIICPREFLPVSEYHRYKFPFVDIRPEFQRVPFEDLVKPRNEEQVHAWNALQQNDNGILQLGCGKGKTRLAQKKIAQKGVPTLVIVPDGGMLDQWRKSILGDEQSNTPPGLRFDGRLGIVQADTFDWKHPITLALVTTLALRIKKGEIPEEFFRYFGLVIYDEVHLIGAPLFSRTAEPFYGDRIGLTATVERNDGLDPIYRYHIGEPFYSDLRQELVPKIVFQRTPIQFDYEDTKRNGVTNVGLLRSKLGLNLESNIYRYWHIQEALRSGRKIICLSHSKIQLRLLHSMFPGSGLIISETDKDERLSTLRSNQLCFAIARLGAVGVDDDRLDTLFWLTPFGEKDSRVNITLQQSMGRLLRPHPSKQEPLVIFFEEWRMKTLVAMCRNLRTMLRKWQYSFDTQNPRLFPTQVPHEVRQAYELALQGLSPADEREEATIS